MAIRGVLQQQVRRERHADLLKPGAGPLQHGVYAAAHTPAVGALGLLTGGRQSGLGIQKPAAQHTQSSHGAGGFKYNLQASNRCTVATYSVFLAS